MRKTKFRWLALLLAMVSLFGVLAIPASADYYYAMKVSVYYKDEFYSEMTSEEAAEWKQFLRNYSKTLKNN